MAVVAAVGRIEDHRPIQRRQDPPNAAGLLPVPQLQMTTPLFLPAVVAYWADHYRLDRMVEDYRRLLDQVSKQAVGTPAKSAAGLPAHFTADGGAWTREIASAFDLDVDFL